MPFFNCRMCLIPIQYRDGEFPPFHCASCRRTMRASTSHAHSGAAAAATPAASIRHIAPQSTPVCLRDMPGTVKIIPSERGCSICFENIDAINGCVLKCGHVFHTSCIDKHITMSLDRFPKRVVSCPLCRVPFTKEEIYNIPTFF